MIKKRGENEVRVTAVNNDVNTFDLVSVIVNDFPQLSIENMEYPEILKYGPDFRISFEVFKRSFSVPKNITVRVRFNNKETQWNLEELESNQQFNVDLDRSLLDPKDNEFEISLKYHDSNGMLFTDSVQKSLPIEKLGFFTRLNMWLNKISRDIENWLGMGG